MGSNSTVMIELSLSHNFAKIFIEEKIKLFFIYNLFCLILLGTMYKGYPGPQKSQQKKSVFLSLKFDLIKTFINVNIIKIKIFLNMKFDLKGLSRSHKVTNFFWIPFSKCQV